jgi:hypothetical protein
MPFDFAAQIEAWRKQLLDTTKRNRLISFKAGRGGGVSHLHPDPGDLWHRLVGDDAGLTFVRKGELIDLPPDPEGARADGALSLFDPAAAPARPTAQEILTRCRHSPRLRTRTRRPALAPRLRAGGRGRRGPADPYAERWIPLTGDFDGLGYPAPRSLAVAARALWVSWTGCRKERDSCGCGVRGAALSTG